MKIIIVGAGKVGELLCRDLSSEGNDITLIEENTKVLNRVLSSFDIMGLSGNGANCNVLQEALVNKADIFIAVTQSDEINLISSVMAKKMGARYTIARVRNPEYSSQMSFMSESLGIDRMLNPESEAAFFIFRNLQFPSSLNVESFSGNKVNMVELFIQEGSFKDKHFSSILVCIVKRGQEVYVPTGNFDLRAGDKIHVTGIPSELFAFYELLGQKQEKIKSVVIVGGGRIAYYLTDLLLEKKMEVKIIEIDEEKANELSETYEDITVIHGDGTNSTLLDEEHFQEYDACISLTGIDEENIILSMYAHKMGIKKTITKINNSSLFNILEFAGLQSIVTPKKIISDYIVKTVRSLISSQKEQNIETLYRLADNRVEAIEFKVPANSDITNIPLKHLPIKDHLLIAYVIRNNTLIFPRGMDTMLPHDRIIIITTEKYLNDINKIIK